MISTPSQRRNGGRTSKSLMEPDSDIHTPTPDGPFFLSRTFPNCSLDPLPSSYLRFAGNLSQRSTQPGLTPERPTSCTTPTPGTCLKQSPTATGRSRELPDCYLHIFEPADDPQLGNNGSLMPSGDPTKEWSDAFPPLESFGEDESTRRSSAMVCVCVQQLPISRVNTS